jgi:methyl-accepting chemotaxis protein
VTIFRNMTLGVRLGIGFGVVLASLCAVSVLGVAGMSRIGAMADRIIDQDWRRSQAAHRVADAGRATFIVALQTLQKTEQTPFTALIERVAAARKTLDQSMGELLQLTADEAGKARLDAMEKQRQSYMDGLAQVMELAETGKVVQGEAAVHQMLEPRFAALSKSVEELVAANTDRVELSGAEQVAAIARARWAMLALGVLATVVGALFAWWIVRSLTRPLAAAVSVAQRISEGSLDSSIEAQSKDEVGLLLQALAKMQEELRSMIGDVAQSASEVSDSASVLAAGAGDSISRAQSRTEATSSTAAAIEEMTVSIGQVAEHAQEAAAIADKSSALAREGEAIVRAASSEMNSIAQSVKHGSQLVETLNRRSAEISTIVRVIKDIADQTNLLALNAAIEAARAGEQGRGFAVVADEVRKLAERTGSATSEIGSMIEAIQRETSSVVETMQAGGDKVVQGVKLADEAAAALEKINAQTMEAVQSVNAIASATREQQAASSDIARNVERIAQMTEESGAAAHHNADSATTLERLASGLQGRVARFKL